MKDFTIELVNGKTERIIADMSIYDQAGNLAFVNARNFQVTDANPNGVVYDVVKVFNHRHYVSFEPTPTRH